MSKIEEFKIFVKENPKLITHVKKGDMTWQKFYEIYDIYGNSVDVWDKYLNTEKKVVEETTAFSIADFMNWIKNVDLDKMQESINSVQRVVGVLQDLGTKDSVKTPEYKPRPLYKHFED